ncbi:MAG: 30S ribosomal protein S7 [Candidatus Bathyarchaeota archaeon]|jgi:small subunit ribosomal protein S7|nr:30S ribosomal protein S7 [Candidatus Bathyarchaeota archaeon]MDD4325154.1 30S ribosomal protein S7 [Candidatus Bathyarchaeota archaeon]MDI9577368.1 30S ribosomal protein S7 [Thermoproteota archaeon]MDT8782234.1 30S ribosomal protein S7 [Candidatus Bathyarchaeota archaeon]NLD66023.1 30S ribosomal protein S7 [Thermoproteota archaeon]
MSQTTVNQPQEIKLFQKWSFKEITVKDIGLQRYLNLTPMVTPHSMGRHEHQRFRKAKVNIVERLINGLMRSGKNAGKKAKATNFVKESFEIINIKTGRNPIEVLVQAVENCSPCEDTTRISYGGVVYHLSVDVAPQRRIDLALRHITEGARASSINNPRSIQETLADELILAANKDIKSAGVAKRNEIERVAQSSR